ncbi:PAS domain S-box-containing protein [Pseudorhizobium tarimense]|uniref:histidine kinase n=1 Tax=Pseudorhizobium tarimense TaxID=1079109 RepID=A0ABV2H4D9_9HYPH|nr:response regulator [Pseudorhizobium tarimense]MCJ8518645.1 response regulator [Pseudorhizobium tarimense]
MTVPASETAFLSHDGELAGLIAQFDWSDTSLGPIVEWAQGTKAVVSLILQSPVPIVTLWNEDGVMIYNDAYSVFAGSRHPQLLGSKVREGWPEVADFNDNVMKVGLAGKTLAYLDQELTLHRRGVPEQVWMNLDYSPIMDEGGRPVGVMAVVVETTGKVRAERQLRGERGRLRKMFEQAPGFMAMMQGPDHVFQDANSAYLALVGHRDILGKPIREALPEITNQGFVEILDRVRGTGLRHVGRGARVALARRPGLPPEERFVDFVFQPILEEDGRTAGIFVQGNDVTDQRRAEIALRRETRHLEVLNRLGADLAAELGLEKVVQLTVDAGVELTGAAFGAFFYNVFDESGESYMLYALSGVERSAFDAFPMPRKTAVFSQTFNGEGVIRSGDILEDHRYGKSAPYLGMPEGHLPVRSYLAIPVISRSGAVIGGLFFGHPEPNRFEEEHERLLVGAAGQVAIALDNARLFQAAQKELADRRRAEEALQELNARLEQKVAEEIAERLKAEDALRQSQKMEALGQLTGGVAHDFNNLLQVISGNLQLLSRDVGGNDRATRRVDNALSGVQRGSKLASQLLAFGRRQPLEPKVVNVARLVHGLEELLRRTLGEDITIKTNTSADLWNACLDPTQIENALLNLAINSRDAMENGGTLTIDASNAKLDEAYARQEPEITAGYYVLLTVSDTGSGMPPEVLAQVFEPFFSTKPVGKGTGLGLSMVYGFVKQSGGHIKIDSEVGRGTTIRLYFPRVEQDEDIVIDLEHGPISGGTETILVAEDDEQVRATVVEMLGELGYRVLKAKDAAGALNVIESGMPIDLVFTDVVMPGPIKSTELAKQARQRFPDIAILFTSGYTQDSIVHDGRLDPDVELLSKPYSRESLARKVRQVLSSQQQRNRTRATLAAGDVPAIKTENPTMPSYRVLLVEDDFLIRMSTADMLTDLGHQVEEAGNAEEALNLMRSGSFDVLMTDLGLPGVSGAEFARSAREISPEVGVVFATGRDRIPDDGAVDGAVLLKKPFANEEIERALNSLSLSRR